MELLPLEVFNQDAIKALQSNRLVRHNLHNMIASSIGIFIAQYQHRASLWAVYESGGGLQHRHTGAFRTHQRAGDVETVFRQEFIQIIAGDAPGNLGITRANQLGIVIAQRAQISINLAAPPALVDDLLQFSVAGWSNAQAQPIVGQDVQPLDVISCFASHHRMRAARVIANHPAQGSVVMRGRVRAKGQVILLCGFAQRIANDAGLHPRQPARRVNLQHVVEILGKVENNGDIAALALQAGASAARQDRRAISPGDANGPLH
jgi:hypothetical protein